MRRAHYPPGKPKQSRAVRAAALTVSSMAGQCVARPLLSTLRCTPHAAVPATHSAVHALLRHAVP